MVCSENWLIFGEGNGQWQSGAFFETQCIWHEMVKNTHNQYKMKMRYRFSVSDEETHPGGEDCLHARAASMDKHNLHTKTQELCGQLVTVYTKMVRCVLWHLKCIKCNFGLGSTRDPSQRTHNSPPELIIWNSRLGMCTRGLTALLKQFGT